MNLYTHRRSFTLTNNGPEYCPGMAFWRSIDGADVEAWRDVRVVYHGRSVGTGVYDAHRKQYHLFYMVPAMAPGVALSFDVLYRKDA